jgi:hypothetical protein
MRSARLDSNHQPEPELKSIEGAVLTTYGFRAALC